MCLTSKGLVSNLYKKFLQINNNEKQPSWKTGKSYEQAFHIRHFSLGLSGKCQLKQHDTNSHPSVKNKLNCTLCEQECKLLDTTGGSIHWHNHFEKQFGNIWKS